MKKPNLLNQTPAEYDDHVNVLINNCKWLLIAFILAMTVILVLFIGLCYSHDQIKQQQTDLKIYQSINHHVNQEKKP